MPISKKIMCLAAGFTLAALIARRRTSAQFETRAQKLCRQLAASQMSACPDQSLIPHLVRNFAFRNGGRLNGTTTVRMTQQSEMRLSPGEPFFPVDATQVSGTKNAGFVWHAIGKMRRIIALQMIDSYVAGEGEFEARIGNVVSIAKAKGPEIAKGQAMRFLAELAWNPDGLVNTTGLSWRQTDALTVDVSTPTAGGTASVRLFFDKQGDIIGIFARDRPRSIGKKTIPTPWIGRFSDYARSGEYRWPRHGEIAWLTPEGEFVYWRGTIQELTR